MMCFHLYLSSLRLCPRERRNERRGTGWLSTFGSTASKTLTVTGVVVIAFLLSACFTQVQASNNITQVTYSADVHRLPANTSISSEHNELNPGSPSVSQAFYDHDMMREGSTSSVRDRNHPEPPGYLLDGAGLCLTNQLWNPSKQSCENCTICHPGTEHQSQSPCGHGSGTKDGCRECRKGTYQEASGHSGLRCRPCLWCDPAAKVLAACTLIRNTQCRPCPSGMFAYQPNVCMSCSSKEDSPECVLKDKPSQGNLSTTPSPTIPTPQASPKPSSPSKPSSNAATPRTNSTSSLPFSPRGNLTISEVHQVISAGIHYWLPPFPLVLFIVIVITILIKRKYKQDSSKRQTVMVKYDSVSSSSSEGGTADDAKATIVAQCTELPSGPSSEQLPFSPGAPFQEDLEKQTAGPPAPRNPGSSDPPSHGAEDLPPWGAVTNVSETDLSVPQPLSIRGGSIHERYGLLSSQEEGDLVADSCGPPAFMLVGSQERSAEPDTPDSAHVNEFFATDEGKMCGPQEMLSGPRELLSDGGLGKELKSNE